MDSQRPKLILEAMTSIARGEFTVALKPSDKGDELDGIMLATNMLAEELDRRSRLLESQTQAMIQSAKMASLGQMSASIAHELNNPLHIIKGFNARAAAVLKKENPDLYTKIKDYLDDIAEGTERMSSIISHLKDYSRLSTHEMKLVSINDVVEKSFSFLSEQLRLRNIRIIKDFSNIYPIVNGDRLKLEQVFINLIVNAKDAIEEKNGNKGGEIKVSTHVKDLQVIIEFQDDGCGMSEEIKTKVFDPFFTTKVTGKGTGLGGSIMFGIINEHKGSIICSSEVGEGATFTISLPLAKV